MPALSELVRAPDLATTRAQLLSRLLGAGFPVTDWEEGGAARTLVELFAKGLNDLGAQAASIAAGGLLAYATEGWLTLLAADGYGLTRNPAVTALGKVRLSAVAGAAAATISAGQLIFESSSGRRFANTSGGTLLPGGTLDLDVQAESPGAAWNVSTSTVRALITQVAGVSVDNPPRLGSVSHGGAGTGVVSLSGTPTSVVSVVAEVVLSGGVGTGRVRLSANGGATFGPSLLVPSSLALTGTGVTLGFSGAFSAGDRYSFSTSWLTRSGGDEERDEPLRTRCRARWPSLGVAPTRTVHELWARSVAPALTRVRVRPSSSTPGVVDVRLATADGPADGATVAAVAAYIADREPTATRAQVSSAVAYALSVVATLHVETGRESAALVEAETALQEVVAAIPIGGSVWRSELIAALTGPAGVTHVDLPTPSTDLLLAADQVPQLTATLTVVSS